MKMTLALTTTVFATGLAGCAHSLAPNVQVVRIDDQHSLYVAVSGIETTSLHGGATTPLVQQGQPVHRSLVSDDGKTLFAYDVQVNRDAAAGTYRLLLKPAKQGPTFAATREVSINSRDEAVRVELMEQPGTDRKVVDVFRLSNDERRSGDNAVMTHVYAVHEMFRKWVHGE